MEFKQLEGCTIKEIEGLEPGSDEVIFVTDSGNFKMWHEQDCCESVSVEDIAGDIDDLIGQVILSATEEEKDDESYSEAAMWTFYRISTFRGTVVIRWWGGSNGWYSVAVSFEKM